MRMIRHIIVVAVLLALLAGIPALATGYPQRLASGADAISSATVVLEQPSGAYVVLINRDRHKNNENLKVWEEFFSGKEISFLFEDISCVTADTDPVGLELARSFQSRLPENQMALRTENITLMLSKLDYGYFDVILMSREIYEAYLPDDMKGRSHVLVVRSEGL